MVAVRVALVFAGTDGAEMLTIEGGVFVPPMPMKPFLVMDNR